MLLGKGGVTLGAFGGGYVSLVTCVKEVGDKGNVSEEVIVSRASYCAGWVEGKK